MIILSIVIAVIILAVNIYFLVQGPPFVSSSDEKTDAIIRTVRDLGIQHIIDLGCGDGKLVIALGSQGDEIVWRRGVGSCEGIPYVSV
jgi:hypothetical protein